MPPAIATLAAGAIGRLRDVPAGRLAAWAVGIALLTTVGVQRCTIADQARQAERQADRLAKLDSAHAGCVSAAARLQAGNEALAAAIAEQNEALAVMARYSAEHRNDAERALAAAERQIAAKATAMDTLAKALRSMDSRPASSCPAGDAVLVIREALK